MDIIKIIPPSGIYRKLLAIELPKYKKPIFNKTKKLYITDYQKTTYHNYNTFVDNNIITKYNTDGSVIIKQNK